MTRAVHYAGAVEYTTAREGLVEYLAGWAACCSGDRAWKIRLAGAHTYRPAEVTCKACLRNMKRAGLVS